MRGLQLEIVASLFAVMLAGMSVVAVVLGSVAVATVQRAAAERLDLEGMERARRAAAHPARLADLAAILRAETTDVSETTWLVCDASGRAIGHATEPPAPCEALVAMARERGRALLGTGWPVRDIAVAFAVKGAGVEAGYLVGVTPARALWGRLALLIRAGAWVFMLAALVFVAFGGYLLRRRIVAPLRALSLATQRVASGDLGIRVPVSGSDELAELGLHFNAMARALSEERETVRHAFECLARSERLATTGQLAAGVAHEVGNPVAAILGYVEVARRDPTLSARGADALERIRHESLRIRRLVRELLDLARPREIALTTCAPAEVAGQVVELLAPQERMAGIALAVHAEPELPCVHTDARRVQQILINLIENAAHAVQHARPAGTSVADAARIDVTVRALASGPRRERRGRRATDALALAIDVTDNGSGIAAEHLSRVFDPFFTTKDPGEGTGLGLWNAQRIAEQLGGRLDVRSRPGHTCFTLLLPAADTLSRDGEPKDPDHR